MKQDLFDEVTAEKIRSKTTDEAIANTFRLDRLDQIAEQTKPKAKRGVRFQIPRINRDGDIDYAPEVDPYEDMDVEGLLNQRSLSGLKDQRSQTIQVIYNFLKRSQK